MPHAKTRAGNNIYTAETCKHTRERERDDRCTRAINFQLRGSKISITVIKANGRYKRERERPAIAGIVRSVTAG